MEITWIDLVVGAIKVLSVVVDLITLPVYALIQRPWEKRKSSQRIKAQPVFKDDKSIVYRNVDPIGYTHSLLEKKNINTFEAVLKWVAENHGDKKCLGTRQILAEEDEVQANGRVFKKVSFLNNRVIRDRRHRQLKRIQFL